MRKFFSNHALSLAMPAAMVFFALVFFVALPHKAGATSSVTLGTASVDQTTLTLTYDGDLNTGSVPAGGDFTVYDAGAIRGVISVSSVSVSGSQVILTLDAAVGDSDTVTLDYNPGANPIQDSGDDDVASFSGQAVANYNTAFITTWNTANAGIDADDQITLPTSGNLGTYVVDWGDGTTSTLTTSDSDDPQHTYASSGIYVVTVTAEFSGFAFGDGGDDLKITDINQWGTHVWTQTDSAFFGCANAEQDLDDIYYEQLKSFLLADTDLTSYLQKTDAEIQNKESLLMRLIEESKTVRRKKNDLVNMRLQGEMNKESFSEQFKPLESQLEQIEGQLPILQAEVDFLKIQHLSSDSIMAEAKDLYQRWPSIAFEEKRTIIEVITNSIIVGKEDISFSMAYMPQLSQNTINKRKMCRFESKFDT